MQFVSKILIFFFRKVLQEYEKTISEMYSERERERVCMEIEKEKLARERDQTLEDLMSAERAFSDVHRWESQLFVYNFSTFLREINFIFF